MIGRASKYSLRGKDRVSFQEGAMAHDRRDPAGFTKFNARPATPARRRKKPG